MRILAMAVVFFAACVTVSYAAPMPADDTIGVKVQAYFDGVFGKLRDAAAKQPDAETFRPAMSDIVAAVPGVFGGSYLDTGWVIRQVLFPSHFLARGFDLKSVKELDFFRAEMAAHPGPQLSEPGHGSIMQPRLTAMRYPVVRDGKVVGIVSVMVRTGSWIKAVGLDKAKAYRIVCRGVEAEREGTLSPAHKTVSLSLPSTEWVIEYEM